MISQLREQQALDEDEELRELQRELYHSKVEANELKVEMELRKLREEVEKKEWEEERLIEQQLLAGLTQPTKGHPKDPFGGLDEFARRRLAFFATMIQAVWRGFRARRALARVATQQTPSKMPKPATANPQATLTPQQLTSTTSAKQLSSSKQKRRSGADSADRKKSSTPSPSVSPPQQQQRPSSNFKPKIRPTGRLKRLNTEQREAYLKLYKENGNSVVDKCHVLLKLEALSQQEETIRKQLEISGDNNLLLHTLDRMEEEKQFYRDLKASLETNGYISIVDAETTDNGNLQPTNNSSSPNNHNNDTNHSNNPPSLICTNNVFLKKRLDPYVDVDYDAANKVKADCIEEWNKEYAAMTVSLKAKTILRAKHPTYSNDSSGRATPNPYPHSSAVGSLDNVHHHSYPPTHNHSPLLDVSDKKSQSDNFRLPTISMNNTSDPKSATAAGRSLESPTVMATRPHTMPQKKSSNYKVQEQREIKSAAGDKPKSKKGTTTRRELGGYRTMDSEYQEVKRHAPKQTLHRHDAAPLLEMYGLKGSMFNPDQLQLSSPHLALN